MSAKIKVQEKYPRACIKLYRTQMGFKSHYIVWADRVEKMRLASGETPNETWKKALETVTKEISQ